MLVLLSTDWKGCLLRGGLGRETDPDLVAMISLDAADNLAVAVEALLDDPLVFLPDEELLRRLHRWSR